MYIHDLINALQLTIAIVAGFIKFPRLACLVQFDRPQLFTVHNNWLAYKASTGLVAPFEIVLYNRGQMHVHILVYSVISHQYNVINTCTFALDIRQPSSLKVILILLDCDS